MVERSSSRLRGIRWYARSRASEHAPYLAFARRRYESATIDRDTQLVIEGFPRSASTFATVCFQMAQPSPVRVAHHLHAPAQIVEAVRRETPVLVTVRHPRDAAISCVIREPYVPLGWALDVYARFYEALSSHAAGVVFARFEHVTTNFPAVTGELNERFGTRFDAGVHDDGGVERCFRLIDLRARGGARARYINRYMSGLIDLSELEEALEGVSDEPAVGVPEHRVARPSSARSVDRESLLRQYEQPDLAKVRSRAERAYAAAVESGSSD